MGPTHMHIWCTHTHSKKNTEQEEQLEEIKRRMGTLMLSDRKVHPASRGLTGRKEWVE